MELIEYLRSEGILEEFLMECRNSRKFQDRPLKSFCCIDSSLSWERTKSGWSFWMHHKSRCKAYVDRSVLLNLMDNYKKPSIFKRVVND